MALTGSQWHWWSKAGSGYGTIDINLPPAWLSAETRLYGTSGSGIQYTGIKSYRQRLSDGSDRNHDFGEWTSWPPVVFDFISSLTFGIATGSNQQGWAVARMDWWG